MGGRSLGAAAVLRRKARGLLFSRVHVRMTLVP